MSAFIIFLTYDGGEDHEAENERGKYHDNKVQVRPLHLGVSGSEGSEVH